MTTNFRGKICRSFFIIDISLLTFEVALLICCLKLSFWSSVIQRSFWWDDVSTWTLLKLMVGWFCICFFLENKTSCPGLLGSELKSNFQLKVHLEINFRSSLRIFALSFSSLTIENRDVSSANSFSLDFNSPGNSLM